MTARLLRPEEKPLGCKHLAGRPWLIAYSDNIVSGQTQVEWATAPSDDVQIVVVEGGEGCPFAGVPRGLTVLTGLDEYDPFGWGPKRGRLLGDEEYQALWRDFVEGVSEWRP